MRTKPTHKSVIGSHPNGITVSWSVPNLAYFVMWGNGHLLRILATPQDVRDYLDEIGA